MKTTAFLCSCAFTVLFGASEAHSQGLVFDDITLSTGTLNVSFGRAVAMVDLDRDGLLDIVCADDGEADKFFRQKVDGTFEDAAGLWGVTGLAELSWGVLAADFDNDGDDDVYFSNGGKGDLDDPGRLLPNRLLRNDIAVTGLLVDVSAQSGDAINENPTFGVTSLDYDRDGFLDLFCADPSRTCMLLRNEGGLNFLDVSSAAQIVNVGSWRHAGSADFDNDGWPDVGVGNKLGNNVLYNNQQNGTFIDRAAQAGLLEPFDNFGFVFEDFDNDGYQDAYIPKYQLVPMGPSPVFLNNGDGTFRNVSAGSGMGAHTDMGHNTGDLDADGYPEIMMGTGSPFYDDFDYLYRVVPNGAGGLSITDISTPSRFDSGGITRQHGQALGDYDRDGDIDIFCNNGGPGFLPSTAEGSFFWRNRGNSNSWVALEIEGVYSNRTGVGTLGKATTTEGRDIYRVLQVGQGFSNTSEHAMHFGIGTDSSVDRIELRWPSGIVQTIDNPQMMAYTSVRETGALLRGTPTIGQVFSYDIAGNPGDLAELGLSMGTDNIQLSGINGPLLIADPYVLLPAFPLNGAGRLSLPIPIPNIPALIGLTFYSQAWIHGAASLGTLSQLHTFTVQ